MMVILFADVKLAADDGLHALVSSCVHKMNRAKYIAVVGDRNGRHVQFFDALDQLLYVAGPIEQRVVSMQMQMDKIGHESVVRC